LRIVLAYRYNISSAHGEFNKALVSNSLRLYIIKRHYIRKRKILGLRPSRYRGTNYRQGDFYVQYRL